jgi:hypothetical protein
MQNALEPDSALSMAAVSASEIEQGLALIRTRQRRMGYVLVGLVPFVLAAGYPGGLPSEAWVPLIVAAVVYAVVLMTYSFRLAFTECPRCRGYYHWKLWSDPWTKKCLHCRLPLNGN